MPLIKRKQERKEERKARTKGGREGETRPPQTGGLSSRLLQMSQEPGRDQNGALNVCSVTVPWTARRSNQSILKEIDTEYSLEGLMLKLKRQYFGHLTKRTDSLEKTLMLERWKAGGEGDHRGRDGWMASLTQWTRV